MASIYGDPEAMRFVGDGRSLTVADCLYWVEVTDKNFEKRGYGMVAFVERDSNDLIGCAGLVHPDQQPEAELKYAVRRDKWRQGFAVEMAGGLLEYAQRCLAISCIQATVYSEHLVSQRVLARLGFRKVRDRVNEDESITQVWEFPPES